MKALILGLILFGQVCAAENSFVMQGKGVYSFLWMDVYEARLYRPEIIKLTPDNIYENTFQLELEYYMSFKGEEISKQSVKEIESQKGDLSREEKERLIKLYNGIFPNVDKGDRITASYHKDKGVSFFLNRKTLLGKIEEPKDAKAFLDIWLGVETSDEELREELYSLEEAKS